MCKGHGGWGISTTPHSLSLFIGGIARKPAVVDDRVEPRDLLSLTVLFYGLVFKAMGVAAAGAVLTFISIAGWLWPGPGEFPE